MLIMSGVKQNPGPVTKDGRDIHSALTHDILTWVFDAAVWGSTSSEFGDRVRALLRHFKPGSMPHRRIVQLATELRDSRGDNVNDQTRWNGLVEAVCDLLPNSALSQQDHLAHMTRKSNEPWMDCIDRYGLFATTCTQVTEVVKTAELF